MNVLLVDDDRFVIEALKRGIDWISLGITGVFTAFDITGARRVIRNEQIDLLLSDIDMPHGSGLELLAGLREEGNDIPAVFLTNYADFSYAQKALELKSFHYFLKPIDYAELTEIIRKALSESALNYTNTRNALSGLWRSYVADRSMSCSDFCSEASRLYPVLSQYSGYACVLLNAYPYSIDGNNELQKERTDPAELGKKLQELMCAIYGAAYTELNVFMPFDAENYRYLTLIPLLGEHDGSQDERIARDTLEAIAIINNRFGLSCSFYIREPVSIKDIPDSFTGLHEFNLKYPGNLNRVVMVSVSFDMPDHIPPVFDKELAIHSLNSGDFEHFKQICMDHLNNAVTRKSVTGALITDFHLELNQIIYSFLMDKGIMASKLFQNETFHFLSKNLHISTYYMELYIIYTVNILHRYLDDNDSGDNVSAMLLKYVDDHFCDDLSREVLSDMFFFDPDYITKIFKKETGMSFKNYVIDKRLTLACKLLTETSEPVHEISLHVGYDNYSYFTRLFKKTYGLTPAEFRTV